MELKEKSSSVDALQELISTIVDCEQKARISPGLCAGAFLLLVTPAGIEPTPYRPRGAVWRRYPHGPRRPKNKKDYEIKNNMLPPAESNRCEAIKRDSWRSLVGKIVNNMFQHHNRDLHRLLLPQRAFTHDAAIAFGQLFQEFDTFRLARSVNVQWL